MRVQVLYTDSSGTYRVRADVRPHNRAIHIIDIIDDDYGGEAELSDFTDEEMSKITALILEEYDDLDRDPGDDYSDDTDEEETDSDY